MMQLIRNTLFVIVLMLLSVGYAASQWFWFTGSFATYAKRVDCVPVQILALVFLIITITAATYWPKFEKGIEEET